VPITNLAKSVNGVSLTQINGKPLYYQTRGSGPPIVFVHGLGGTSEAYTPLISAASLDKSHTVHLLDLEGHGLSPTSALSPLSIDSFAADTKGVFDHAGVTSSSEATLVAHSMGCLIALQFVLQNPGLVKKLILLGPPPNPLPEAASKGSIARAALAREKGMAAVVDAVAAAGTSEATKRNNPVALGAVRLSLLGQDPEAYAKACQALAGATTAFPLDRVDSQTLVITGDEDKVSPPAVAAKYASLIPHSQEAIVLKGVGHWHIFEDIQGVANAVKGFIV
jgi:pimeloyl-ACP methyl ester carboxylesterase